MTAIALSIAGSDPSGGAGIQADLKSFSARGVYGAAAITLITVQNTQGVRGVEPLAPALVADQATAVLEDLEVGAVKIGALGTAEIAGAVARALADYRGPVVLDPVMVAKSGDPLLGQEAVAAVIERLLPMAALVTPNLPEAAKLAGMPEAQTPEAMLAQARAIRALGAGAVLLKGGHGRGPEAADLLLAGEADPEWLPAPRIDTRNTHGTGCSLSSGIAAELAKGRPMAEAVAAAKDWLTGAIRAADSLGVGKGRGPVHHFHPMWPPA